MKPIARRVNLHEGTGLAPNWLLLGPDDPFGKSFTVEDLYSGQQVAEALAAARRGDSDLPATQIPAPVCVDEETFRRAALHAGDAGRITAKAFAGAIEAPYIAMRIELMQMSTLKVARLLELAAAVFELQAAFRRWVDQPRPPCEAAIRRAHSYWREVRRSEAEFKAAFPNWK